VFPQNEMSLLVGDKSEVPSCSYRGGAVCSRRGHEMMTVVANMKHHPPLEFPLIWKALDDGWRDGGLRHAGVNLDTNTVLGYRPCSFPHNEQYTFVPNPSIVP